MRRVTMIVLSAVLIYGSLDLQLPQREIPGQCRRGVSWGSFCDAAAVAVPDSALMSGLPGLGMTLKGGQDGTVLKDLTIEGEDMISVVFARPELVLDLPLRKAPGLVWDDSWEKTDLFGSLLRMTAFDGPECLARPWLSLFVSGKVAVFRPEAGSASSWKLTLADSRGKMVRTYEGKGKQAGEIVWDGRTTDGTPATPGLTYSFVVETTDRAGNIRTFVSEGFEIPPYMLVEERETILVFSGDMISSRKAANVPRQSGVQGVFPSESRGSRMARTTPEPLLIEAASWLNQSGTAVSPVLVVATARTAELAESLAEYVSVSIEKMLAGDPGRISCSARVRDDAPDNGTVTIAVTRQF